MKRNLLGMFAVLITMNSMASTPRENAESIIRDIVGFCQVQGMLQCEPKVKGVPELFDYIRLFKQVRELEQQFERFVNTKYKKEIIDFEVLQASLRMDFNMSFNEADFIQSISSVEHLEGVYRVVYQGKNVLTLEKDKTGWFMNFPEEMRAQFLQTKKLYQAGQLKRSILAYRMLEADLADLSKDELESKVSKDIAPIIVDIVPEEEIPRLYKWLVQDLDDVILFYSEFKNISQMKAHIVNAHGLQ